MTEKKKDAVAAWEGDKIVALRQPNLTVESIACAKNDMDMGKFDLGRIKMPSGGMTAFAVPTLDGEEVMKEIDVVIAFVQGKQRKWHRETMEESGGGSFPDCQSIDGIHGRGNNELEPENLDDPGTFDYLCDECQWSKFGSKRGPNGEPRRGQDCSESIHIFFFWGEMVLPMMLAASVTSLKPTKEYLQRLALHGRPLSSVITRLSLAKVEATAKAPAHAVLVLKKVGDVPEERRDEIKKACDAAKAAWYINAPTTTPVG